MNTLKRFSCGMLAAFFITYAPISSYAAATSIAISAGTYAINLILSACGIEFTLPSIMSLIGEWKDMEDYNAKGASGELGLFSQYLYNQTVDTGLSEELRQSALEQSEALNNLIHSAWGATVSGVKGLISAIKSWLSGLNGYGTLTMDFPVNVDVPEFAWIEGNYVTASPYPLRTPPSYTYIYQYINSNDYVFTSFSDSQFSGYATVKNWYKPASVDVAGYYDKNTGVVHIYTKDGDSFKSYNMFYYYSLVNADGTYRYGFMDSDYGTMSTFGSEEKYLGNLPFPVFASFASLGDYFQTGVISDVYEAGQIILEADGINVEVQKATLKDIPDVISLPASQDAAIANMDAISDTIMTDSAALKEAIFAGGLAVDWVDEGVSDKEDEKTDADLKGIVGAIDALPKSIADTLEERAKTDGETAKKRLSLPVSIVDKFPFCVPFDAAYLIESLAVEKETPVFAFPVKFNFSSFNYNETFYLDFTDYDALVSIFRIMQDVLFCAGLIVVTRNLIRG